MKTTLKLILVLFFILTTAKVFAANPLGIDQLYVFGDSLSDEGVMNNDPQVVAPKQPTFTITGGSVWPTELATLFGINAPTPNNQAFKTGLAFVNRTETGTDYAAGGATTAGPGFDAVPGVYEPPALITYTDSQGDSQEGQVNYYIRTHAGNIDPNGLYVVFSGSNDLFVEINSIIQTAVTTGKLPSQAELQADLNQTVTSIVTNVKNAVTQLHQAGAKHIVVMDLPDLSETPEFGTVIRTLPSNLQTTLNQALELLAASIQQTYNVEFGQVSLGYKVYMVDVVGTMHNVYDAVVKSGGTYAFTFNGTSYKVTNFTTPLCTGSSLTCNGFNPATYDPVNNAGFFADGVHPSTQGHQIIANAIYNRILAG